MPRRARLDYPGAFHHVIARGIERKYIFKEEYDKQQLYTGLKELLKVSNVQIYAWSIMSNHFHLAIQTGKTTLSEFMRSLLTRYAINYNKRHKRNGYLFQNRYKSVLCDKEEYLLSLIRYVHLNPVKAKLIAFGQLKKYKWTGHRELMNAELDGLLEKDEVLRYFGNKEKEAKSGYYEYVKEGLNLNEDFIGGGLIRSMGGVKEVLSSKERQMYDDRILGNGYFVERILKRLKETDEYAKFFRNIDDLLQRVSKYYQIGKNELLNTKTMKVRDARNVFVYLACTCLNCTATKVGQLLKIKQSAASIARGKGMRIVEEKNLIKKL
ncbi:MAG: transposase [Candidatus Aureabacteria bacterium]|nr:transposase [Candidatus Auribacterota bacterium]